MTCIVGVIDKINNNVIIGADSAGVTGLDIRLRKDEKVFKNGDFVIGCTSSFRMIQLLRYCLKIPKPPRNDGDIFKYMCTKFVDAIRKCFDTGGFLQKTSDGDEQGGEFLIGYKNRLFCISYDFQVCETYDGFDAVGCGADYVLGSLETSKCGDILNEDDVRKALQVASKFSGGVEPPFIIEKT